MISSEVVCACYSEPEPAVMECWAPGVVPTIIRIRRPSVAGDLLDSADVLDLLEQDSGELRSVLDTIIIIVDVFIIIINSSSSNNNNTVAGRNSFLQSII